jgi:hypothetical protein
VDGDKTRMLTFDTSEMRHFDHGYAVTSHSSQGLTADRVLINVDTTAHPELINTRFAYVSVSRASNDARIYTNNVATLADRLSADVSKASAVQISANGITKTQQSQLKEQTMTNTREQTPEELRREMHQEIAGPAVYKDQTQTESGVRHYAPLLTALRDEANGYDWKRETGDIQSYQHHQNAGWLHIDSQGQFYDRHAQSIPREVALEAAGHYVSPVLDQCSHRQSGVGQANDKGISL